MDREIGTENVPLLGDGVELTRLVEALQTYQLELETQNQELRQAQYELNEASQKYQDLYRQAPIGYFTLDENGLILELNIIAAELLGEEMKQLIHQELAMYLSPESRDTFQAHLQQTRQISLPQTCDLMIRHHQSYNQLIWVQLKSNVVLNEAGQPLYLRSVMMDITAQKQLEGRWWHHAHYDMLTGLPNRLMFFERLEQAIQDAQRQPDYLFAVLFLDLDRFKYVNDSFGHLVGDQMLVIIGQRLARCLGDHDMVARLGGDEFTIFLHQISDMTSIERLMARVHAELTQPIDLQGQVMFMTVSIGIVVNNKRYIQAQELLRDADTAMYQAKKKGRGQYAVFKTTHHRHLLDRLQLENELWQAITQQEFVLYYQPIMQVDNRQIVGCEVLIRWQNPRRGLLSPALFIVMAEEIDLIVAIDKWVLQKACQQFRYYQTMYPKPAHTRLTFSVNISMATLQQPDITPFITHVLAENGVSPSSLHLEISEHTTLEIVNANMGALRSLRALGVELALDDFGTGCSSLAHLKEVPFNYIKLDQSFVANIGKAVADEKIIRAMIMLGHDLGLGIVAEGVETLEQIAFLQQYHCDKIQGNWVGKPMVLEDVIALL